MRRKIQILAKTLKENKLTIALAESMTCGLVAHKLGTVSDTSDFFMGSIICYDEKVKTGLLEIKKSLITKYTAESQQVTDALAKNLYNLIAADIHVAITGLASPGGSETKSKPAGTMFCTIMFRKKLYKIRKRFYGSPIDIRDKSCELVFSSIVKILNSKGIKASHGS